MSFKSCLRSHVSKFPSLWRNYNLEVCQSVPKTENMDVNEEIYPSNQLDNFLINNNFGIYESSSHNYRFI